MNKKVETQSTILEITPEEKWYAAKEYNASAKVFEFVGDKTPESIKESMNTYVERGKTIQGRIVEGIEKNTPLFTSLSQCVTAFEQEIAEYSREITELMEMIKNASHLPIPAILDIPETPEHPDIKIIGESFWYIDAPILYDSLVQQHRIEESIYLICRCDKYKGKHIDKIEEWVLKTNESLRNEFMTRILQMHVENPQVKVEFTQLIQLGYVEDAIALFFEIAAKSLDQILSNVRYTGEFLRFIEIYSQTLFEYLAKIMDLFTKYFSAVEEGENAKKYEDLLTLRKFHWIVATAADKIPINSQRELFQSNLSLVREALRRIESSVDVLLQRGLNVRSIFLEFPNQILEILGDSVNSRISSVRESVLDEEWNIDISEIQVDSLLKNAWAPSLQAFKNHIEVFITEISHLFSVDLFFQSANLLGTLIKSYSLSLREVTTKEGPNIAVFCFVLVQISITLDFLPSIFKLYKSATSYDFPDIQQVTESIQSDELFIVNSLVDTFVDIWKTEAPLDDLEFESMKAPEKAFLCSQQLMADFFQHLYLPKQTYNLVIEKTVAPVLEAAQRTGTLVETVEELNSFDFHWAFFVRSMQPLLTEDACQEIQSGVQSIGDTIAADIGFEDSERATYKIITKAISSYIRKHSK